MFAFMQNLFKYKKSIFVPMATKVYPAKCVICEKQFLAFEPGSVNKLCSKHFYEDVRKRVRQQYRISLQKLKVEDVAGDY